MEQAVTLEKLFSKAVWNGVEIDLPVNHDLAKYGAQGLGVQGVGDPMSLVRSIEHAPGRADDDYQLDLYFRVTSLIPYNYMGELYYDYFAWVEDIKILEVQEEGILIEFYGMAACNVVEDQVRAAEPEADLLDARYCGIARQFLAENPLVNELDDWDIEEAQDEIYENHPCGVINDALVVLHDFDGSRLQTHYDSSELDMLYGSGKEKFADLTDEELNKLDIVQWGEDVVLETVTAPDGKQYRLLISGHQD